MRLAALCLLLLSLSLCLIPEINIAASAPVLNQEIAKNLGPLIVQQVVNHTMNQTFVEEMSFGVVHVNISLSNLTVTELDINWKTNILVPKGDYAFRVNFKDITVALASSPFDRPPMPSHTAAKTAVPRPVSAIWMHRLSSLISFSFPTSVQ